MPRSTIWSLSFTASATKSGGLLRRRRGDESRIAVDSLQHTVRPLPRQPHFCAVPGGLGFHYAVYPGLTSWATIVTPFGLGRFQSRYIPREKVAISWRW